MEILVFGDSIPAGYCDIEGGWVARLRKHIETKNSSNGEYYCPVYNLSIPGNTTKDLINRFEFEIKQRLQEERRIIIFEIGANDSLYYNKEKLLETSIKDFSKNIIELIKKAKKYSSEIIFLGLIPVDEEKVNPVSWRTEISYRNDLVKAFNSKIKELSTENRVAFLEIFDVFDQKMYKKLLEDGVHPNSKGHEKIFFEVKNFLNRNNNI